MDRDRSVHGGATAVVHTGGLNWATEKNVVEQVLGRRPGVISVDAEPGRPDGDHHLRRSDDVDRGSPRLDPGLRSSLRRSVRAEPHLRSDGGSLRPGSSG